jgi:hypothetical protein
MGCRYTTELLKLKKELEEKIPNLYDSKFLVNFNTLKLKPLEVLNLEQKPEYHLMINNYYYPILINIDSKLKDCLLELIQKYPKIKLDLRIIPYCVQVLYGFTKGPTLEKILKSKIYLKQNIDCYGLIYDNKNDEELGKVNLKCVYRDKTNEIIIEIECMDIPKKEKVILTDLQKSNYFKSNYNFLSSLKDSEGNKISSDELTKITEYEVSKWIESSENPKFRSNYLHCILNAEDLSITHIDGEQYYYYYDNYKKRYNELLDIGKGTIKKETYKLFKINGKIDLKEISYIAKNYFQFSVEDLKIKI